MKQILWFRRDLRIIDNEILANVKGEVLPRSEERRVGKEC